MGSTTQVGSGPMPLAASNDDSSPTKSYSGYRAISRVAIRFSTALSVAVTRSVAFSRGGPRFLVSYFRISLFLLLFPFCTSLNVLFFLVIASAEEGFADVIISPASLATMTR